MPEDENLGSGQETNDENLEGGGDDRSWVPEDLREEKSLVPIKDVAGLAKGYVEAQKMIGGSVRIPGEDATPEEWGKFHSKMGRPDDVAGYGITKPETLPAGVTWDEGMVKWFGDAAFKHGASKELATGLMNDWNEYQFSQAHAAQQAMKVELDGLRESWGNKFDGNVEIGLRGIERLLPPEKVDQFKALLNETGIGNRAIMLEYAYQVGNVLKEDGYILGDGHGGAVGAEGAKAKIEAIKSDKEHPYWKGDKSAIDEVSRLYKVAFPGREMKGAL